MSHAKDYGLTATQFGFDLDAIVKRSRGIAAQMNNGVQFLMKKNKVDIIWGEAVLTAPGEIKVAPTKKTDRPAAGPDPQERAGRGHLQGQEHHHRHRRPAARPARHRARWRKDLDLFRGDEAGEVPQVAW